MKYLLSALLVSLASLSAQGVRLESSWSADTVLIGQPVVLRLTAQVSDDAVPHFPGLTLTNPDISLDSTRYGPYSVAYSFTFWKVGRMVLPGLPVQIERRDGTITTLSTDSMSVMVVSVLRGDEADIREIKDMVPLQLVDVRAFWRRLAIFVLLVGLVLFIWLRRRREGFIEGVWERRAPDVEARAALGLLRDKVYQPYDAPERYEELSRVLREYLEFRFLFKALEMTTSEIKERLPKILDDPASAVLIGQLLERCDLAKFAKQRHANNIWRNDLDMVDRIIEKTRPDFEIQTPD